jgi:hypothetical protein
MPSSNESFQAEQDGTEPSSAKTAVPPMAPLRKSRIVVMHFEAEGDSDTVRDAMNAMLAAISSSNVSD